MNPPYDEQLVVHMREEIVSFLREQGYTVGAELTVAMVTAIIELAMDELIKEDKKGEDSGNMETR